MCNLIKFNTKNKLFKGSTDYIQNGYDEYIDAVNKIIEIALKNEKTYIMSIGSLTNVALAIKKEHTKKDVIHTPLLVFFFVC